MGFGDLVGSSERSLDRARTCTVTSVIGRRPQPTYHVDRNWSTVSLDVDHLCGFSHVALFCIFASQAHVGAQGF